MIIVRSELCSGCRTCEIVCSYHHTGVFGRRSTSINVKRVERKGEFKIKIFSEQEAGHLACDLCESEDQPLCVRFCSMAALVVEG